MNTENETVHTFTAAGKRFNRSRRWAYDATKQGLLDKVIIPGRKRGMGVTTESIERLLKQSVCKANNNGGENQ